MYSLLYHARNLTKIRLPPPLTDITELFSVEKVVVESLVIQSTNPK